ncbi:MAG: hypothetical protein QM750_11700 [Rubrivivax sp.]
MAEATTTPSTHQLRATVEFMDGLSQDGFSQIATIAKLVLKSMEAPEGNTDLGAIAVALQAIWSMAEHMESCVSSTAEQVGCGHEDEAKSRRVAAWIAARQRRAEHG